MKIWKKVCTGALISAIVLTEIISSYRVSAATCQKDSFNQLLVDSNSDSRVSKNLYSVTLDDEEWENLDSFQEMLKASQLDEDTLAVLTTDELLDAVLNYPLLVNVFLYDSLQEGIQEVGKQFNGMHELLNRSDFEEAVFRKYMKTEVPGHVRNNYNKTLTQLMVQMEQDENFDRNVTLDFMDLNTVSILECMLVHYCDISNYTTKEKEGIVAEVLNKFEDKKVSSFYNDESEFISEVITDGQEKEWKKVLDSSASVSIESQMIPDVVKAAAKDTITKVTVKTPNNSKITCQSHSANKKNSDNFALQQKKTYPGAALVGNGYSWNNCHAYAWTGRQDIWMNDPSKYVSDGSYVKIKSGRPSANGQKAVWGGYIHSGIVMNYTKQDPVITSKWGGGCIWQCPASYCPYSGTIVYYKRNK